MNQKLWQYLLCTSILFAYIASSAALQADSNKGWCAELGMTSFSPISTTPGISYSSGAVPIKAAAISGDWIATGGSYSGAGRSVSLYNRSTMTWDTLDGGVNGYVTTLLFHDDDLYVGGVFSRAGSIEAQNIARWNLKERKWYALKSGVKGGIDCLCWYRNELYVGGWLTAADTVPVRSICRWNGTQWNSVGKAAANGVSGMNPRVLSLAVYNDMLVVGGHFSFVGSDTTLVRAAMWNGAEWSRLPNRLLLCSSDAWDVYVSSVQVVANNLVLSGSFKVVKDDSSSISSPLTLLYDGRRWQSLDEAYPGSQLPRSRTFSWPGGFVRLGGKSSIQTMSFQLEYFELSSKRWTLADSLFTNDRYSPGFGCLVADDSTFFISGRYTAIGSRAIQNICTYAIKSGSFQSLNSLPSFGAPTDEPFDGSSLFFFSSGDSLFLGGTFNTAGMNTCNGIARWGGAQSAEWLQYGPGFYSGIKGKLLGYKTYLFSYINCGAFFQNKVLIGGNFESVDSTLVNNLLEYDGSASSSFHSGLTLAVGTTYNSQVKCLKTVGNSLYVGGAFVNAGTKKVNSICRWTNGEWFDLAGGLKTISYQFEPVVNDIAEGPNNSLYVAGNFKHASDTIRCAGLAQWDGTRWTAPGVDRRDTIGVVSSVLSKGDDVYIGGSFHTRGARVVNSVARWDGTSWSDLDGGLVGDGHINSMVMLNERIIVAGLFSAIGDITANNIAAWDTRTKRWTPLGDGIDGEVSQVYLFHDSVFCAGTFTRAGNVSCTNIAVWSDQLASPVSEHVFDDQALLASPNPCSARVHLRYAAGSSQVDELQVFSSYGELMYSRDNLQSPIQDADLRIDTQGYPAGCYACVIRTRDQQIVHCRFVKQ